MRRALLLVLALAAPAAALDVPFLSGRVNDHARLLPSAAHEQLEEKLKDFEQRTGHQLAILTLPSLEGEALEDFSLKVSRTWALGRKGENDGILLLISRNDRKLRIEVGHGLEGTLPDIVCGRIIQDVIVELFRAGDYEGGVAAGAEAIIAAAEGRYTPAPSRSRQGGRNDFAELGLLRKILISFLVFGLLSVFELIGITLPGIGWVLYFFLIPFWAAFPTAIWGPVFGMGCLLTHLIGLPLAKRLLPRSEFGRRFSMKGNSVYYGNTLLFTNTKGGSGGGFSGGGGGGFSGGGGSFGGGGSSGSW